MTVAGVIAEYNPFHLGHAEHLAKTRQAGATHIVAVVSGSFVQRGEPAIVSEQARARAAILGGADLVISLPVPWAMSPAQTFARGGVSMIAALGCAQLISFGSECGDISLIEKATDAVSDERICGDLKDKLSEGMSFASAREYAVGRLCPEAAQVLQKPNDTLACEYVGAMRQHAPQLKPVCILREGSVHDGAASASNIREIILRAGDFSKLVSPECAEIIAGEVASRKAPANMIALSRAVLYKMRTISALELAAAPDVSEGIENRIISAARAARTLDELYSLAKTKRYPHARIRRIVMGAFIGLNAKDSKGIPPYIRVLGLNARGREILAEMRGKAKLPVVMRTADFANLDDYAKRVFALECTAADIRSLSLPVPQPCGSVQRSEIIII